MELDDLLGRRLVAYHWGQDNAVFTFEGCQVRLVVQLLKTNPPPIYHLGLEIRDGLDFVRLTRNEAGVVTGELEEET